jgi:hypothetical protein
VSFPAHALIRLQAIILAAARKIVEHAQLLAIRIRGSELAQTPGLVLWLGENLRARVAPAAIKFIESPDAAIHP